MDERAFLARDAAATRALAAGLGALVVPGTLVLLCGNLGAGKTSFAQGLAAGMGVTDVVVSPTFALVREYDAGEDRPRLVHVDFYRLSGPAEVRDLALDEYLSDGDVVAIEWPDRGAGALPDEALEVTLVVVGEARRITFAARGEAAHAALARLEIPAGVEAA